MLTGWIVAIVIALILLKAAFGENRLWSVTHKSEGSFIHRAFAYGFAIAALMFVLAAVVLAGK
jgi:hypothetical protein